MAPVAPSPPYFRSPLSLAFQNSAAEVCPAPDTGAWKVIVFRAGWSRSFSTLRQVAVSGSTTTVSFSHSTKGGDRYRRAMYTFRFRSVPNPMLQIFDAPNGDFSCVRRTRSYTPLQALTTLNEPVFMECARALAALTLNEGGDSDESRLRFAFRQCLTREPNVEEATILSAMLNRQLERFTAAPDKARELIRATKTEMPAKLVAGTAVPRTLLNLDETITKE